MPAMFDSLIFLGNPIENKNIGIKIKISNLAVLSLDKKCRIRTKKDIAKKNE